MPTNRRRESAPTHLVSTQIGASASDICAGQSIRHRQQHLGGLEYNSASRDDRSPSLLRSSARFCERTSICRAQPQHWVSHCCVTCYLGATLATRWIPLCICAPFARVCACMCVHAVTNAVDLFGENVGDKTRTFLWLFFENLFERGEPSWWLTEIDITKSATCFHNQ